MKIIKPISRTQSIVRISILLSITYLFLTGCQKTFDHQITDKQNLDNGVNSNAMLRKPTMEKKNFSQVNLVANNSSLNASRVDPMLQNAWGLAFTPNGFGWISANGASVSVIYTGEGAQVRPPVTIPSASGSTGGTPTGVVFNGSTDFLLPAPNNQPARFLFAGEDGTLSGWNFAAGNSAVVVKDNSATSSYKGLALATNSGANYLYAANFKTAKIDVFDQDYNSVSMSFSDPQIPSDFAPFNVQNIGGMLYVTYAKVGADGDDVAGIGNGYVDIYTTGGVLVQRFVSGGQLNSPWGIAKAPPTFFGDDNGDQNIILIGNFGNGRINAYNSNGKFMGELAQHPSPMQPQKPIIIDGLWAISFAPVTATSIDPNRLYFTAGPNDEEDGLYGYIKKDSD